MPRVPIVALVIVAGCYRGGDGPQEPKSDSFDAPGKHCDACYESIIPLGVTTALWTSLTAYALAKTPDRPNNQFDRRWLWAGIGLGAATLALGTTHAVLNRDELASGAIAPGIIGVAVGGSAIVTGVLGLTRPHAAVAPMSVPGGGGVAISGRF